MKTNFYVNPNKPRLIDVMIDIETLGLTPGCKILAIGAIASIGYVGGKQLPGEYFKLINQYTQRGLQEDSATRTRWYKQDPILRDFIFSGSEEIKTVLLDFAATVEELTGTPVVWGNAASFDISILEAAYKHCNVKVPWHYKNVMCFRTLQNLAPLELEPAFIGSKHNPLDDARHQWKWMNIIKDYLQIKY